GAGDSCAGYRYLVVVVRKGRPAEDGVVSGGIQGQRNDGEVAAAVCFLEFNILLFDHEGVVSGGEVGAWRNGPFFIAADGGCDGFYNIVVRIQDIDLDA